MSIDDSLSKETENIHEQTPPPAFEKTEIVEDVFEPRRLAILPPSYRENQLAIPQKPQRPSHLILDALPYIEPFHNLELRSRAEKLVADEMKKMEQEDPNEDLHRKYLDKYPLPNAPYIVNNYEQADRIQRKEKILDEERYECRGPRAEQLKSLSAWIQSVENVQAQLNHGLNQQINIELCKQYLPQQWKKHTADLKAQEQYYQALFLEKEAQMAEINKQRKKVQMECEPELHQIQKQWWELVDKNNQIELQCFLLQKRIDQSSQRTKPESQK
ncbi:hypothetical protein RFI_24101 [Reticulomyxa filosa]|uniref:Uncharacterized protein n=1 Tax=Reticulomyxa filosa TaxID=46433 RepID=X6MHA4_RETFI|nr:hypothetical protein RFI_24101 [Reticulomyxa filosa]|eukprot:ETO13274.1 hypothetical protein RFI_24101 [Reticulomyxa filosa]